MKLGPLIRMVLDSDTADTKKTRES